MRTSGQGQPGLHRKPYLKKQSKAKLRDSKYKQTNVRQQCSTLLDNANNKLLPQLFLNFVVFLLPTDRGGNETIKEPTVANIDTLCLEEIGKRQGKTKTRKAER